MDVNTRNVWRRVQIFVSRLVPLTCAVLIPTTPRSLPTWKERIFLINHSAFTHTLQHQNCGNIHKNGIMQQNGLPFTANNVRTIPKTHRNVPQIAAKCIGVEHARLQIFVIIIWHVSHFHASCIIQSIISRSLQLHNIPVLQLIR
jgi:hypothetical protein